MNRNEMRKQMQKAIDTRFRPRGEVVKCPSILLMAKYIATYLRLECRLSSFESSTDRPIPGSRLRHPGKGRVGTRLEVYDENEHRVFEHRAGETYRHNTDVAYWILQQEKNGYQPKGEIKSVRAFRNGEIVSL